MPKKKRYAHFENEIPYFETDTYVIGIDEVGRGCLAGPVHVGGVCFGLLSPLLQKRISGLEIHDSKQCTRLKREKLNPIIKKKALSWSIHSGSVEEINSKGIIYALEQAAVRVVSEIITALPQDSSIIVFTDTIPVKALKTLKNCPQKAILKGDCNSISIAAASIIAKVQRDAEMDELHTQFTPYKWNINKGYATQAHRDAIKTAGVSPNHRKLYLRKLLAQS